MKKTDLKNIDNLLSVEDKLTSLRYELTMIIEKLQTTTKEIVKEKKKIKKDN